MSLLSTCLGGPSRRLLKAIILSIILVPLISIAQVTIKEKVEVRLKESIPKNRFTGTVDYFSPPQFLDDEGTPVVPLASTLTASGSINVTGRIDPGCWAQVGYWMYDGHALAWRDYSEGGGEPLTVSLEYGQYMPVVADINLMLHNPDDWPGTWSVGTRTMTITEDRISYEFTGQLHNLSDDSWTSVTGSASLTGNFEPGVQFAGWGCSANPIECRGRDSVWLSITPLNNYGTPYSPLRISSDGVQITVSIDAQEDYVFLSTLERDQDGKPIQGTYATGKQLTLPLSSDFFLVYDESKGTFDGTTKTVQVTVSGGGASSSSSVNLLKYDLLLGESRYYYVVANSSGGGTATGARGKNTRSLAKVNSAYLIMPGGDPSHLPPDMETNVDWNVSPTVTDDTLGVYYETHNESINVPIGMIRLVGRYWREGNNHPVRLEANWTEVQVGVTKPKKLGISLQKARDVFNREINIDDSCIIYGGRYGIPPQFLKGQISIESPTRTFTFNDGSTGRGFAPAYRYEPFTTQFSQWTEELIRDGNPFVVLPNSLREPPPPNHLYVLSMDYIKGAPVKVWYFIENYSQLVNSSNPSTYGTRLSDGRMSYGRYKSRQR